MSGLPQRYALPANATGLCDRNAGEFGMPPVKLLKDRSNVTLAGSLFPSSLGISPENRFEERFKY